MSPPDSPPPSGTLWFQCNICGTNNLAEMRALGREIPSCQTCHSSGRARGIMRALSLELFGKNLCLPDFPERRDFSGLGMTDWEEYARRLAQKFCYENTFYHQEPKVDIAGDVPRERIGQSDFIISSEIFEHIVAPVRRAFENVFRLLKPGGVFILTTPFGNQAATNEHFPELHDFEITERGGAFRLRNVTPDGRVQEFTDLIFHGGPGSTLEMRVFARADLMRHLVASGFEKITVHEEPDFPHGIWWPEPWSYVISARKPR